MSAQILGEKKPQDIGILEALRTMQHSRTTPNGVKRAFEDQEGGCMILLTQAKEILGSIYATVSDETQIKQVLLDTKAAGMYREAGFPEGLIRVNRGTITSHGRIFGLIHEKWILFDFSFIEEDDVKEGNNEEEGEENLEKEGNNYDEENSVYEENEQNEKSYDKTNNKGLGTDRRGPEVNSGLVVSKPKCNKAGAKENENKWRRRRQEKSKRDKDWEEILRINDQLKMWRIKRKRRSKRKNLRETRGFLGFIKGKRKDPRERREEALKICKIQKENSLYI